MADFYVSSTAYAAVSVFAVSTAYTVGQFVRAISPTAHNERVYRCTTAGTSAGTEATWGTTAGGTTTQGTAVFTEVTGRSTYGWSAAAGRITAITSVGALPNLLSAGDRIFVSSDHNPSAAANTAWPGTGSASPDNPYKIISVNKAGSVPPVAADYLPGATESASGTMAVSPSTGSHWEYYGLTLKSAGNMQFNSSGVVPIYAKDCTFELTGAGSTQRFTTNNPSKCIWDNVKLVFSHASQGVSHASYPWEIEWRNSPTPLGGTLPAALFILGASTGGSINLRCRDVDFSAITAGGAQLISATSTSLTNRFSFYRCVLPLDPPRLFNGVNPDQQLEVEMVECGTSAPGPLYAKFTPYGSVRSSRSIYRTDGALVGGDPVSFRMTPAPQLSGGEVTSLECPPISLRVTDIGSPITIELELLASQRAVLDPRDRSGTSASAVTISTDLLSTSGTGQIRGTMYHSSGLKYFEANMTAASGNSALTGISLRPASSAISSASFSAGNGVGCTRGGTIWLPGGATFTSQFGAATVVGAGNTMCCAINFTTGLAWFRRDGGDWNASPTANPATGVGGRSLAGLTTSPISPMIIMDGSDAWTINFGATTFAQTMPVGFTAWNVPETGMTLSDDEVWMELEYLADSGTPMGSVVSTKKATVLTAPTTLTSSAEDWTGEPANSVPYKLEAEITPIAAGLVTARVFMKKKAGVIAYVDPMLKLAA